MGLQIIKQTLVDGEPFLMEGDVCTPGLYAIWDTVVDNFAYVNCTREEIVEFFVRLERERVTKMVTETLDAVDAGLRRTQFTQTFVEAVDYAKRVHGQNTFVKSAKG